MLNSLLSEAFVVDSRKAFHCQPTPSTFFLKLLPVLPNAIEKFLPPPEHINPTSESGKQKADSITRASSIQFALLESSSVDDDLAQLKREISVTSRKGELPAGRTAVGSSNTSFPFRDMEIEKDLNELRRKS